MYEYTLVNFNAVFLRFVFFGQMTRGTFSLSNDNSATNRAWHRWKAHTIVFHMVPLSQNVIFSDLFLILVERVTFLLLSLNFCISIFLLLTIVVHMSVFSTINRNSFIQFLENEYFYQSISYNYAGVK